MRYILALAILLSPWAAHCQSLDFTVRGGADWPIDLPGQTNTTLFQMGGAAVLDADYELPSAPLFFGRLHAGFERIPVGGSSAVNLDIVKAGLGAGIALPFSGRCKLKIGAEAGIAPVVWDDALSAFWFLGADAVLWFHLNSSFGIGIGTSCGFLTLPYSQIGFFIAVTRREKIDDM